MTIKLYDFELSHSAYRVRLLLSLLGISYETLPVDVLKGAQKQHEYLDKLNPLGLVPVLVDGDLVLRDSYAIDLYLTRQYGGEKWFPVNAVDSAKIMEWLSYSNNEINHSLEALRRFYFGLDKNVNVEVTQERANKVLTFLNTHLAKHEWLALERPTLADIACFPAVALAKDGKVSLEPYIHVLAWIERVKSLPNFISMPGI